MPFSVFADVKRKVVKTHRYTIAAPKVMVFLHKSVHSLSCLETFEFVSFYTQKLKFYS